MNKCLFFCLIFFSSTISAQSTDSSFVKKKNTVGIGGSPFFYLFEGGLLVDQSYFINYKRLGTKFNFRSSINYFYFGNDIFHSGDSDIITSSDNDSIWYIQSSNNFQKNKIDVRVGLEKKWDRKRSTWIVGLDLLTGYSKSENHYIETYYPYETTFNNPSNQNRNTNFSQLNVSNWLIGLSPVVGWEYQINRLFGFSVQYRLTAEYRTDVVATKHKRLNFVDGESLNEPIISNNDVFTSKNDFQFDTSGLDLFLTVNF